MGGRLYRRRARLGVVELGGRQGRPEPVERARGAPFAVLGGEQVPLIGLDEVLGLAAPALERAAQPVLRERVAALRGFTVPPLSFVVVALHASAGLVDQGE